MADFRVDFKVKGDLVLEVGRSELRYVVGKHTYVFADGQEQVDGHVTRLIVSVIGPHADLVSCIDVFRALLADQLNLLSFITQHRFEIEGPTIALEWTPGQGDRTFRSFASQDSRWPPDPSLSDTIIESVRRLAECDLPRHVLAAVASFRAGLLQIGPEHQVQQFWIAFEGVIDGDKDHKKTPVECVFCGKGLACASCKKQLMRTPMAKPLMRKFLREGMGDEQADQMFRAFDFARNRLFHGATVADTERRLQSEHGVSLVECAEHLGRAAYWSIYGAAKPHLPANDPLQLFLSDSVVNMKMQFEVGGVVPHSGPTDHPVLPKIEVSIQSGFNEPAPPSPHST